jgi:hypothetical protein
MNVEDLKAAKEDIERIKNRIARDRDTLRDYVMEVQDVLESVDGYIELQEEALDNLSQYL